MNCIKLRPTDILFFRDGRPMGGASAGHGEAWPLPTMTDAALHAALHRSSLQGHSHDQKHGRESKGKDSRAFGSLTQAGPFPVNRDDIWFFPRPLDIQDPSTLPSLLPLVQKIPGQNSLANPLRYPIANTLRPSKDRATPKWLSTDSMNAYLREENLNIFDKKQGCDDSDFSDTEHTVGIGIDPNTGTTGSGAAKGQIYSANYLRLQEGWRLGLIAETSEKVQGDREKRDDLIQKLFDREEGILVGGQQRHCTARLDPGSPNPLPWRQLKTSELKPLPKGRYAIKWTLLTPAIFPATKGHTERGGADHSGGWLPNWIDPVDAQVLLKSGDTMRNGKTREQWRKDVRALPPIAAKLVAALTGKSLPVTGWALAHEAAGRSEGGAKPTLLAVPAGSIYYFEADSPEAAVELANALSWHGALDPGEPPKTIVNRRSTSMGEKGFGLGVCTPWNPYPIHS